MAHLTGVRMHLAAEALATRTLRVAEVADKVGYVSEKAFSRAFKRWAGDAPRAFGQRTRDLLDNKIH
jgi:AraC-like DNA-binding protein